MTHPVCFVSLLLLVTGVEQLQSAPCAAVQRSSGCCEGHRLVSSPARPAGLRRGNGGPLPSLLEHSDRTGVTEYRHRLTGLQPGLVQTRQRAGEHTRLLPEPDPGVEIPITHPGGQAHRTFIPSALLGGVSRWRGHRNGSRRRDAEVLECLQQNTLHQGIQISVEPVHQDTVIHSRRAIHPIT